MRILITGSTGQLGRELRKVLCENDLLTPTHNEIDIRDVQIIPKIIELKPEIIIHTAAYTDVDGCEENQDLAWEVNSIGTRNVATAAEELKAKLFYISTDYIFDGRKSEPYIETDKPNPLNVYGKTKLSGENLVKDICSRFSIIRTSWLYSNSGKNFVNAILHLAKVKEEIKVVNDQIGSPTYAKDLAYVIKRLISSENYGIYHASGEGECSWYDFAQQIVKFSSFGTEIIPIKTCEISRAARRPYYSVLSNARLRKVSIFMPLWEDALKEFTLET